MQYEQLEPGLYVAYHDGNLDASHFDNEDVDLYCFTFESYVIAGRHKCYITACSGLKAKSDFFDLNPKVSQSQIISSGRVSSYQVVISLNGTCPYIALRETRDEAIQYIFRDVQQCLQSDIRFADDKPLSSVTATVTAPDGTAETYTLTIS